MAVERVHRIYVDDIDTGFTVRAENPQAAVSAYRGSLNAHCYGVVTAELDEERNEGLDQDNWTGT